VGEGGQLWRLQAEFGNNILQDDILVTGAGGVPQKAVKIVMLIFHGAKFGMTVALDIASCEGLPLPDVFALASSRKIAWTSAFNFAFVLRVSQCQSSQEMA
jgi:hypothetical protein